MQSVNEKEIALLIAAVTGRGQLSKSLTSESALLGAIVELDSMAVMNLIVALENRYSFRWHDDEMEESIFSTLNSLTDFVQIKVGATKSTEVPTNKDQPAS